MIKKILVILTAMSFAGCLSIDTECCDLISSEKIADSLYIEKYRTFCAGVFGETIDYYVTDSTSFRQPIGGRDEHGFFRIANNGDTIETFNVEPHLIADTVAIRTIPRHELFARHDTDSSILTAVPLFGENSIKTFDDHFPASSYQTDDGYHISQVQYKSGSIYQNAVYYTDLKSFNYFIGVYIPGADSNNFSVKQNSNRDFNFYNVAFSRRIDTLKHEILLLKDLKKKGLAKVCK